VRAFLLAKKPFTQLAAPIGKGFCRAFCLKSSPPEARILVSSASSHFPDKLQFVGIKKIESWHNSVPTLFFIQLSIIYN